MLKLERAKVEKLFKEAGKEVGDDWSDTKLAKRVAAFAEDIENVETDDLSEGSEKLLNLIKKEAGGEAEFAILGEDEGEGKGKKDGKGKKKEKSEGPKTDQFGTRLTSKLAKANEQLSKEPKSMREIADGAGIEGTIYNHLNNLVSKNLLEKNEEGKYHLPGGGKKKVAKESDDDEGEKKPKPKKKAAATA